MKPFLLKLFRAMENIIYALKFAISIAESERLEDEKNRENQRFIDVLNVALEDAELKHSNCNLSDVSVAKRKVCKNCIKHTNCKIEEWYFDRKWSEKDWGCIQFLETYR